ncbi:hypothetical protein D3C76_949550 [compost metagenome]
MLEGVAEGVIGLVVELPVRIAQVLVEFHFAGRGRQLGALQRQELAGDAGIVAVVLREEGQAGVFVEVPGDARRDVVALAVDMVDLGVAVAYQAADAIEHLAVVVDLAGAVESDLLVLVAADLGQDFMAAFFLRTAADHVQQAAGRGLAIDGGSRAAQQGDALQVPGLQLGHDVGALRQRQAVEELGGFEAAHLQPLGAGVAAVAAGDHAGHVAHRVVEVLHVAVDHLLAGGDGDRARGFQDRRVGLGAGHAAAGHVALHRTLRVFLLAADGGGGHAQGVLRDRTQAEGAGFALHQLQAAALERLLQRADGVVAALHGVRGAAAGQRRVEAQAQPAFGGDAVEGAGQRAGGNLVAAHAVIGDRAAQRGGEEDGGGQQMGPEGQVERTGHRGKLLNENYSQCLLAE